MSHNMVLSRVSLGCCINLHCAMLRSVHWSSPIEPSLSKWICGKKISIRYKKNTERRAEIFLFSFFLSFNLSWVYLFETDWANVQTKLLICATNVQRCNVEDWKARWFICSVFNDCLAPLASVSLQGHNKKTKCIKWRFLGFYFDKHQTVINMLWCKNAWTISHACWALSTVTV